MEVWWDLHLETAPVSSAVVAVVVVVGATVDGDEDDVGVMMKQFVVLP